MFSSAKSKSKQNNMMMGLVVLLVVGLILWLTFGKSERGSCPRNQPQSQQPKIIVPIGNGQSVALTKEQYAKLSEEAMKEKIIKEKGFM
jgi:hypothetical protein